MDPAIRTPVPLTARLPATEVSIRSHQSPGGTVRLPCTIAALSSDSVARLRERAVLVERTRPPAARTGAGRPASVLALAPPSGVIGLAGELAHIHAENDGAVCRCGGRGCLMTTFNARRLVDRIQAVHPAATSMDDVMTPAAQGDPGVWRLLHDLGHMIGRSLAEFSLYAAPDGVVIDGILQSAATPVIDGIREAMYRFAPPAIVPQVRVVAGALAQRAELRGAAVLARSRMSALRSSGAVSVTPRRPDGWAQARSI